MSKTLLKRLISGIEAGWKKAPATNHEIFTGRDPYGKVISCCAVGHAAFGLYGSSSEYTRVEKEFKKIKVVNPTYDPHTEDPHTYVGEIKDKETISLPTAMSLLVVSKQNGGYNWTTPQVLTWLKTHLED